LSKAYNIAIKLITVVTQFSKVLHCQLYISGRKYAGIQEAKYQEIKHQTKINPNFAFHTHFCFVSIVIITTSSAAPQNSVKSFNNNIVFFSIG